jgi:predicted SAM-dependent methyltransferase
LRFGKGISVDTNLVKIDVGSGPKPRPGYQGVDLLARGENIIQATMDKLPFEDKSVDAINCSHALEHVPKKQVVVVLKEFHRVLKADGILEIEVPSLVWCCENWLKNQDAGWNMDAIFGNQDDEGQYHYTGFTNAIMLEYLHQAGFLESDKKIFVVHEEWSHEQNCLFFKLYK